MSFKTERFLTIGFPDSRRVKYWEAALQRKKCTYDLLSFEQVITDLPEIIAPTTLRITSPGENFEFKKQLLKLGGYRDTEELVFEKGLIISGVEWYRGWQILLQKIKHFIEVNPLVKTMNLPASILLAFHKLRCQQYLNSKNIRVPNIISPKIESYDSLLKLLKEKKQTQVFIKPYHGSSASGVMAFRQATQKQILYTTIDLKPTGLYNSLRLKKYTSAQKIEKIINAMCPTGLMAEAWIPKKTFRGKSVDFRVLVINKKAAFIVPRMSNGFITNLHLGNEKGNIAEVEQQWGKPMIEGATLLAEQAVQTVGGLFYAGVDVAISTSGIPYVLEINAFGDMLLNIFKNGLNTYEFELEEWV